jgi:hypothetical protein
MASLLAVELRHRIEAFLGRELTVRQVWHCEEIIINFRPWVPLRYLDALAEALPQDNPSNRNWGLFYYGLYAMGRGFRGYTRRSDFLYLRGRLHRIYRDCDLLAGDGFGEKDLAAILFLANDCTDSEVGTIITIARIHGFRTLRHLRGIILKNRAVAVLPHLRSLKVDREVEFKAKVEAWGAAKYPVVDRLRELYAKRISNILSGKSKMRFTWDDEQELSEESDDGRPYTLKN